MTELHPAGEFKASLLEVHEGGATAAGVPFTRLLFETEHGKVHVLIAGSPTTLALATRYIRDHPNQIVRIKHIPRDELIYISGSIVLPEVDE